MRQFILLSLTFILVVFSHIAAADPIAPVHDQQLSEQVTDIQNILSDSMLPEISQQSQAMRSVNSTVQRGLMGSSGIGAFNNNGTQHDFSNWTPSSADLVNMVQQGLQTGSLADQIKYYNQLFPVAALDTSHPSDSNNALNGYSAFSAVSTNAALSVADKGFDNAPEIIRQINLLYQQIDQQQTLKQGMDLNSVILLKIATLQTDLIRIQAQQLKMLGVSQQESNVKRTLAARFIRDVGEAQN